jgi:hypothetical protein
MMQRKLGRNSKETRTHSGMPEKNINKNGVPEAISRNFQAFWVPLGISGEASSNAE